MGGGASMTAAAKELAGAASRDAARPGTLINHCPLKHRYGSCIRHITTTHAHTHAPLASTLGGGPSSPPPPASCFLEAAACCSQVHGVRHLVKRLLGVLAVKVDLQVLDAVCRGTAQLCAHMVGKGV